jgi:hypothetical protein
MFDQTVLNNVARHYSTHLIENTASAIMEREIIRKLRERYLNVPQVVFVRSLEKAKTLGDLFDMLDTFPSDYPVEWDEQERRWIHKALVL